MYSTSGNLRAQLCLSADVEFQFDHSNDVSHESNILPPSVMDGSLYLPIWS